MIPMDPRSSQQQSISGRNLHNIAHEVVDHFSQLALEVHFPNHPVSTSAIPLDADMVSFSTLFKGIPITVMTRVNMMLTDEPGSI